MRRTFFRLLFALAAGVPVVWAQVGGTRYINDRPTVADRPIDASTFVNLSDFIVFGFDVFTTLNTQVYTNLGNISAQIGIRFQMSTNGGDFSPSAQFVNSANARVSATGTPFPELILAGQPYIYELGGFLSVWADSIVNRGSLSVSFSGDLQLRGSSVDLRRSTVEAGMPQDFLLSGSNIDTRNPDLNLHDPPYGVSDRLWRSQGQMPIRFPGLLSYTTRPVTNDTPRGQIISLITNAVLGAQSFRLSFTNPTPADITAPGYFNLFFRNYTNSPSGFDGPMVDVLAEEQVLSETNQVVNAVIVVNSDPRIVAHAAMGGSGDSTVTFLTVVTNNLNGGHDLQGLQLTQDFTSRPTNLYRTNFRQPSTAKPDNFLVERVSLLGFDRSAGLSPVRFPDSLTDPTNFLARSNILATFLSPATAGAYLARPAARSNLFTEGLFPTLSSSFLAYTNRVETNDFSAYTFVVSSLPSVLPAIDLVSNTNYSGRIAIDASNLRLEDTRMRAQGVLNVRADNFSTSRNTSIAAPFVNYDLGVTNGPLVFQGLTPVPQPRLEGSVTAWVASWTNFFEVPDPRATDTNNVQNVRAETYFRLTIVYSSLTLAETPQYVAVRLRAPEVVVRDPIMFAQDDPATSLTLAVDGNPLVEYQRTNLFIAPLTETLTVESGISLTGTLGIDSGSFPRLNVLTNLGSIFTSTRVLLGSDRTNRMERVVNNGTIFSGGSVGISVNDFVNRGSVNAGGALTIDGSRAELGLFSGLRGESLLSLRTADIVARGPVFLSSSGSVELSPTDRFYAPAAYATVSVTSSEGVALTRMPAVTDVSGVSVQLSAGRFGSAFLNWPGVDRGASQAGFSNNAAFSLLSLNVQEFGQVRVESSTPTGNDAIYVQVLDLQGPFADALTNGIVDELVLAETIDLAPGMRIYFAAASAGAGTVDVSTLLDGALGGRLRLVRPAGSVAPDLIRTVRVADGAYVRVPARLLVSATVDSDGDGIPNAVDATPFSGVSLSSGPETINGERFFRLEWNAAPNTTYEIQSADSAAGGAWSRIGSMSNTSAGTTKLRFHDPISGSAAKVYRIVYSP